MRLSAMLFVAHAALLSACGPHPTPLRSGLYRMEDPSSLPDLAPSPSFALEIDRSTETLRLLFGAEQREARPMKPRPPEYWRPGCTASLLELIDLGEADLVLGSVTLERPVLSASCLISDTPEEAILFSGGDGPALQPCSDAACVIFRRVDE